jgi:hypothetical protein
MIYTDPKDNKDLPDTIPATTDEGSKSDPNLTELKGFTDSDVPLEPTEPDPDEVNDAKSEA